MFNYIQVFPGSDNSKLKVSKSDNFRLIDATQNLKLSSEVAWTRSSEPDGNKKQDAPIDLPPLIGNSTLVHQRASAKEFLAAASANAGASLPLMIGGRSKCVLNIVDTNSGTCKAVDRSAKGDQDVRTLIGQHKMASSQAGKTAARAELRRRNDMISVVRPVVSSPVESDKLAELSGPNDGLKSSLIDEMMGADMRLRLKRDTAEHALQFEQRHGGAQLKPLPLINEYELKQQLATLRREEFELTRGIKRQHDFVMGKLEERKRNLLIVQSVWVQRDFKRAMEKLLDIYHQGLVFSCADKQAGLSSLNTSLVVDVLGVITLRPKLWNLEVCQLLMPIIINDLLLAQSRCSSTNQPARTSGDSQPRVHQVYQDVAIKCLKLIVTQFGGLIKSTIESQKESSRLLASVDLSREERFNRCQACFVLLKDAYQALLSISQSRSDKAHANRSQTAELKQLLATLLGETNSGKI